MEMTTIHPAESYLRNETNPRLYTCGLQENADACSSTETEVLLALSLSASGQKAMCLQTGQASSKYTIPRKNRTRIRTENLF